MKELFIHLCNFSVVSSVAILIALVLRPLLKKGPSFIRCAFLTLVFIRLLIPVSFWEMPFDVPTLFNTVENKEEAPVVGAPENETPVVDTPVVETPAGDKVTENVIPVPQSPVKPPVNDAVTNNSGAVNTPTYDTPKEENVTAPVTNKSMDVPYVLSIAWAIGMALMLGYMLISNLVLKYKVRNAIVYDSRIRVLDKDCSPFVFGVFKPIIYIPSSVNKVDWPYIIAHESSHIKRLDHIVKPLAFIGLCLYWFNPLIWVAYILLSKDIEYACDEKTVKDMEKGDKKAYSLALLSVSHKSSRVFAPLSFGKVNVKERIKRVMKYKTSVWAITVTAVICIGLFIFAACTPDAVTHTPPSDDSSDVSADSSAESAENSEESEEDSKAESNEESNISDATKFNISVEYVSDEEADVTPDYTDKEQVLELIKIWVNKPITDFKFISLNPNYSFDDGGFSYYDAESLFELEELSPDTPVYIKTYIIEGLSNRGIHFTNDKGEVVCYRIMYDSKDDGDLYLEDVQKDVVFIGEEVSNTVVFVPQLTDGKIIYRRYEFKANASPKNVVSLCISRGLFPNGAKMQSFEIKDRIGYLDMNTRCYEIAAPLQDYGGILAVHKTFLENFDIDELVVTYNGKKLPHYDSARGQAVFNTDNITRITLYKYYGGGTGSTVDAEYMEEITSWLKTVTVGEIRHIYPVVGDDFVYVEIEYADGSVIKKSDGTVVVNGVTHYTSYAPPPQCYDEILSRCKLGTDTSNLVYKTTEEETNYALGKTYSLTAETVDADYARYSYLGEYSGDYTWCDYDFNKLTDGVVGDVTATEYGSDPFGVPGVTVMHEGTNRIFEYIIDLGDHYGDISSLVFRNVRISGNRGFKVRIAYVSDDKVNFTKITGTMTEVKVNAANDEYYDCTYKLDTPAKGRFLRILLTTSNCYVLQLEEIEVWNK